MKLSLAFNPSLRFSPRNVAVVIARSRPVLISRRASLRRDISTSVGPFMRHTDDPSLLTIFHRVANMLHHPIRAPFESRGKFPKIDNGNVACPAFNVTNIGAVQSRFIGNLLLRETKFFSPSPYYVTERTQDIFAGGLHILHC